MMNSMSDTGENPYIPMMAEIQSVVLLTARETLFRVLLPEPLNHRPGQFVMVSVPGIGECAISISSGPDCGPLLEMVIRKAGNVTGVIHQLNTGDFLGIRGPFGSGFHMSDFQGRDIVIIAGGLGLVPLRSLIIPIMAHKADYGTIHLITGARTPSETLFREQLSEWKKLPDCHITEMVDSTDFQPWDGETGLVTEPIHKLQLDEANTRLVLCGPPVMYKFVLMEFKMNFNLADEHIYVDLERRMRCGLGKCGHCQINHIYCCKDGPVFRYSQLQKLPEALA